MWFIEAVEISGGFLPGLRLQLPPGLTCIIGPRGSGKSTLAEALRFGMLGTVGAPKSRLDLIQANIGPGAMVNIVALAEAGNRYIVRRSYREAVSLIGPNGEIITTVDLDRGTFLPLDAYTGPEIEAIADETLGEKRRTLLDELQTDNFRSIQVSLAEHHRQLQANASRIREAQQKLSDITEQIEEMGDPEAKLGALGPATPDKSSTELLRAARQMQCNVRERRNLESASRTLSEALLRTNALTVLAPVRLTEDGSANDKVIAPFEAKANSDIAEFVESLKMAQKALLAAQESINRAGQALAKSHAQQESELSSLSQLSEALGEQVRLRTQVEQQITMLQELRKERLSTENTIAQFQEERKILKGKYLEERENCSNLRNQIAAKLEQEAGKNVRIRVIRNADVLFYQQMLGDALKGARVRNHEEILANLLTIRPEHLAQLIQIGDVAGFEAMMGFGAERSRRILETFQQNIDPLELEIVTIEDRIRIELNVAPSGQSAFKDASELSRGQKCTALLPILLARRDSPLIIDQPEDNLDNHFIYETVVNAICRLKTRRQMIFITHNANIPVLAEADLVVVMNSDGKIGYVEKQGSVDHCRDEIIDLLEGGRQAFDLRRKRYEYAPAAR